jgi:hypothetical protein
MLRSNDCVARSNNSAHFLKVFGRQCLGTSVARSPSTFSTFLVDSVFGCRKRQQDVAVGQSLADDKNSKTSLQGRRLKQQDVAVGQPTKTVRRRCTAALGCRLRRQDVAVYMAAPGCQLKQQDFAIGHPLAADQNSKTLL